MSNLNNSSDSLQSWDPKNSQENIGKKENIGKALKLNYDINFSVKKWDSKNHQENISKILKLDDEIILDNFPLGNFPLDEKNVLDQNHTYIFNGNISTDIKKIIMGDKMSDAIGVLEKETNTEDFMLGYIFNEEYDDSLLKHSWYICTNWYWTIWKICWIIDEKLDFKKLPYYKVWYDEDDSDYEHNYPETIWKALNDNPKAIWRVLNDNSKTIWEVLGDNPKVLKNYPKTIWKVLKNKPKYIVIFNFSLNIENPYKILNLIEVK